jgi:hypothetical protein
MKFNIGDKVRKIKGYEFEGIVIGIYPKIKKERVLVSVEAHSLVREACAKCVFGLGIIDEMCNTCDGKGYRVREENCNGMVHIFAEQDIELI